MTVREGMAMTIEGEVSLPPQAAERGPCHASHRGRLICP
jgi:hypothetical protein